MGAVVITFGAVGYGYNANSDVENTVNNFEDVLVYGFFINNSQISESH